MDKTKKNVQKASQSKKSKKKGGVQSAELQSGCKARSEGAGRKRPSANAPVKSDSRASDQGNRSASGKGGGKKGTQSFKHVDYEHKRPKLTKELADNAVKTAPAKAMQQARVCKPDRKTPRDPSAELRVIPLGGLDAIGKNMTVFECGDDIILDDAGLMFPDDDHPGIDLILPDYTYVLEHADKLRGIVITHGHEDHTGSLPYLLKDLDIEVPVYASKLTLGLIEGKLKEHRVHNAKLIEVRSGDRIELGCMSVRFFSVNHSIPGAMGIFLQSPAGSVLHTGDFKLDQTPIDGVLTDYAAISRFAEEGVDLLMSDSTNAQKAEFTPSEAEVGKVISEIISRATGKVLIASFASHIHRMQQICDAAVANGRKVIVTGRSMIQNTDIARRLGYLRIDDADIIDAYEMNSMPDDRIVVLCTGSQGEPLSALARIANGEHRSIEINRGDTVIISATPVPGNEKAVTRVINSLAKIGADVYDKSRAAVHVSGHGGAEELKLMLTLAKPQSFMPVHGEASHLRAHALLAQRTGVSEDNIFICENGDTLQMVNGKVRLGEPVQSGIVYVDGLSVGDTSQDVLDERNALSEQGFAVVSAAYSPEQKIVLGEIAVQMRGITGGDDMNLQEDVCRTVTLSLKRALSKEADERSLRKIARDSLLSILWERTKQRPMVIVNLLSV